MAKLAPIKLGQVPIQTRVAAASRIIKHERLPRKERLSLFAAAVRPSDRTYWVPEDMIPPIVKMAGKGVTNA